MTRITSGHPCQLVPQFSPPDLLQGCQPPHCWQVCGGMHDYDYDTVPLTKMSGSSCPGNINSYRSSCLRGTFPPSVGDHDVNKAANIVLCTSVSCRRFTTHLCNTFPQFKVDHVVSFKKKNKNGYQYNCCSHADAVSNPLPDKRSRVLPSNGVML